MINIKVDNILKLLKLKNIQKISNQKKHLEKIRIKILMMTYLKADKVVLALDSKIQKETLRV